MSYPVKHRVHVGDKVVLTKNKTVLQKQGLNYEAERYPGRIYKVTEVVKFSDNTEWYYLDDENNLIYQPGSLLPVVIEFDPSTLEADNNGDQAS